MPRQLNTESIFKTIRRYYIDQIISGSRSSFGAQVPPPSIIVYPGASGVHPIPVVITWVRMNGSSKRLAIKKTKKPQTVATTTKIPATKATPKQKTTTATTIPARLCGGDTNVRCHLPTGLMDMMGLARATTTTPKPTKARPVTSKPEIPLNPNARSAGSVADESSRKCHWDPAVKCSWTCSCKIEDYLKDSLVSRFTIGLTTTLVTTSNLNSNSDQDSDDLL